MLGKESLGDSEIDQEMRADAWSKIKDEVPFSGEVHGVSSVKTEVSDESDSSSHIVLAPRVWDPEEENKSLRANAEYMLALFDKYDFDKISESAVEDLLDGESVPSPTMDSESLIENVIWVNRNKLNRTDLSDEEKDNIRHKLEEAELARNLLAAGDDRRGELVREIEYYNLSATERTNDKWMQIHGFMTEDEKREACLRESAPESVADFVKQVIDKIDIQTVDKIIEAKKSGDKETLINEVSFGLAFLTQFDNQKPVIEYTDGENGDDACHNYLGYGVDKITLNKRLLTDDFDADYVVMTVAHEMFHAYQNTLMRNADKTDERAQLYRYNLDNYTEADSEDYKKYLQYRNQLVEAEAFCFGEQFRDKVKEREDFLNDSDKPRGLFGRIKKILGIGK